MTMRRFTLSSGDDLYITLQLDTSILTVDLAKELNNFWSGSQALLTVSEGDVHEAVARRAASGLLSLMIAGVSVNRAVEVLGNEEGWPGADNLGISIVECCIPHFDPADFDVEELV